MDGDCDGGVLVAVADGCGGIREDDLTSLFDLGWQGVANTGAVRR
jgi:hypothetical protein